MNQRVFAKVDESAGWPDGLSVDREGAVWSAHWDGWRITRYAPDGVIDCVLSLPVPRPTSCTFGNNELNRLFITSARIGLSTTAIAEAPLSGALFDIDVGVKGIHADEFGG